MEVILAAVVLALLVFAHLSFVAYVYLDAAEYAMSQQKWAIITLLVPFFGLFAYVFERGERREDPAEKRREEMFADGPFRVHKSRADEMPGAEAEDGEGEEEWGEEEWGEGSRTASDWSPADTEDKDDD